MADTTTHPEYCPDPTGDHKHSESWYDCKPCEFCSDDTPTPGCDCGRPSHAPGGAALAEPIKVEIDVYDDDNLIEEARDAGCVATLAATRFNRKQYHIAGPKDLVRPLLQSWGYDEEEYLTLAAVTE